MERIVYRKTLDVHKNGVQFLLQGFETADVLSRVIEISLMASGDAIDFPLERIVAMMYVTTPNATEPSINKCTIKDNKIIYDVLPITEEGITEMQVKLIEAGPDGAKSVLASPKFSVEVTKSGADDDSVEQTTTFTALEDAMAKAKIAYDERFLRMELDSDCMFKAYYADGTYYETDILKELFVEGTVKLSQSYAKGGTGIRAGEDTDNSMYYSNVAKSESLNAKSIMENSEDILEEVKTHGVYTAFSIDFETGDAVYVSPSFKFRVNTESGEMEAEGHNYTFNDDAGKYVEYWLASNGIVIADLHAIASAHSDEISELRNRITPVDKGGTGADNAYDARSNLDVFSKSETASESTLGLFGLSANNSSDTILRMFGSHWWRRIVAKSGYELGEGLDAPNDSFSWSSGGGYYAYYYFKCSDSVTVTENGITLDNPIRLSLNYDNNDLGVSLDFLKGKYFIESDSYGDGKTENIECVYKADDDNSPVIIDLTGTYRDRIHLSNVKKHYAKYYNIIGEAEYLHSTNKDEYPEGTDDIFTYEYIGVPFENARNVLGIVAKIRTGSYVGTGAYGENNKNTITVDFTPKLMMLNGDTFIFPYDYGFDCYGHVEWGENSISWWNDNNQNPNNNTGETYHYVILG